jgi:hypothetical protein
MPAPFTSPALAYASATFLGAKVRSFTTSLGWGVGQPSQLTVALVDDPQFGATFAPPAVGTPVYFSCGQMSFAGLFQKREAKRDISGNPVYEVVVVDPREILDGAQVVVGGYNGSVNGMPNLFNCYGYWEGKGFGASGATEAGMPWSQVLAALLAMANSPDPGAYGGPLLFRGNRYGLDLSQLPTPPAYYRIGGVSVGLLEVIAQLCEDGGCDFFIELVGTTIRVRTVSRRTQPPLGTITAITNTNTGTVVRSTSGVEVRNELTSAFLVGGDVTTLWGTVGLTQFWGYDILGNPVIGAPQVIVMKDKDGKLIANYATEGMNLNAAVVADVLGAVVYPCTTLEMRLAQVSIEEWSWFMWAQKPQVAKRLQLPAGFGADPGDPAPANGPRGNAVGNRADWVNDAKANAIAALDADKQQAGLRLYELVRGYADEYMGRKFLTPLPFVFSKSDPETLKVTTSWEVADAAYVADGAQPLGISPLNADTLTTPDGRYRAFVVYNKLQGVDLGKVSHQGSFIENGLLYQEVQVDPQFVYVGGVPTALVTVPGAVTERTRDFLGDNNGAVWGLLQRQFALGMRIAKRHAIPARCAPLTRLPVVACVPLKSNILTYGPWFAAGAPGKVRFEQDPGLTPWAYGGFTPMAQAGNARVVQAITDMQLCETGTLELAGPPAHSLGDTLQAGGPNVTSMDVSFGTDGVTTSYRFQTFTPRFGVYTKQTAERAKRVALAAVELRRNLRAQARDINAARAALADAARADRAWRQRQAKAFKRQTPNDVLQTYSSVEDDGRVRVHPGLSTMEEAIHLSSCDEPAEFQRSAMMSLSGLVRPFSTGPSSIDMATYATPTATGPQCLDTLNPFKDLCDIEVFSYGSYYSGCHAWRRDVVGSDARVFGLRGPLLVVGWGYGFDGNPVPGSAPGEWTTGYMTRPDLHKAGPMDPLWHEGRGVWTVHGTARGVLAADLSAGGSAAMTVTPPNGPTYTLTVHNHFSAAVTSGTKVIANYMADDNAWYVVAADCVTTPPGS